LTVAAVKTRHRRARLKVAKFLAPFRKPQSHSHSVESETVDRSRSV
jgi:hypothetical protein